jgi:hypothetical protein
MFEKNLATVVGALILGMGIAGAAEAITLKKVDFDYGGTNSDPIGWQSLGWEARGRAGTLNTGITEFLLRKDGTDPPVIQPNDTSAQAQWNWNVARQAFWFLDWDKANNKVSFEIGRNATRNSNQTISTNCINSTSNCLFIFDQIGGAVGSFTNFSLETLVRTDNPRVSTSTTMELRVNKVNGFSINPLISLANGKNTRAFNPNDSSLPVADITKFYFYSDTPISSMSGYVRMDWEGSGPQGPNYSNERVTFKIEGGTGPSPFASADSIQPVPEPAPTFGFLAVGAILAGTALKKNRSN